MIPDEQAGGEAAEETQDQPQHALSESEDQHAIVGDSGLDPLTRSEQQPQESGHSSAPPASEQSGVGASGIPDNPGADGGASPEGDKGAPAEGEQQG